MKSTPWIVAAILLGLLAGAIVTNMFTPRIGVVDIGKVIDESPQAAELNRRLNERYEELVAQLEGAEEVDEEELAEQERQAYAEYLRFRQELEDLFQARVDEAVASVARSRRLQIVVDSDVVRHGGIDISDDIIQRLQ